MATAVQTPAPDSSPSSSVPSSVPTVTLWRPITPGSGCVQQVTLTPREASQLDRFDEYQLYLARRRQEFCGCNGFGLIDQQTGQARAQLIYCNLTRCEGCWSHKAEEYRQRFRPVAGETTYVLHTWGDDLNAELRQLRESGVPYCQILLPGQGSRVFLGAEPSRGHLDTLLEAGYLLVAQHPTPEQALELFCASLDYDPEFPLRLRRIRASRGFWRSGPRGVFNDCDPDGPTQSLNTPSGPPGPPEPNPNFVRTYMTAAELERWVAERVSEGWTRTGVGRRGRIYLEPPAGYDPRKPIPRYPRPA